MAETQAPYERERVSSGIPGLDTILRGGLPSNRIYLVEGGPGTGKTTLGLQFLVAGAAEGDSVLYASLLQTEDEIEDIARAHHWSLDNVHTLEVPGKTQEQALAEQTVFSPAAVELDEVVDLVIEAISEHKPRRMVLDSLSELSVMVDNPYQLRRQLIKLKHALLEVGATALITAGESVADQMPTTHTIVHGLIELTQQTPSYGEPRRVLTVHKIRGIRYHGGRHDFEICTGGIEVYPRPVTESTCDSFQTVSSNNAKLDKLFGGGLNRGAACLILGTTGAGKSTLASLYAAAEAGRGNVASIYCFDEGRGTYLHRSRGLKLGIADLVERDAVKLREYSFDGLVPGQLLRDLHDDVENNDVKMVVFDSYTGYLNLMQTEQAPITKLHEVLRYLSAHGVLTLLIGAAHGLSGPLEAEVDASYLADTVVLMRHFEAAGTVRQCISVLKKRHGPHERTIREVEFVEGGLALGQPLKQFSGVMTGTPRFQGSNQHLLDRPGDSGHDAEGSN